MVIGYLIKQLVFGVFFTFLSREILLFCYIYDMIICTLSHTYDPSKHSYAS